MNERIFKLALKAMDFQGAVDIDTELKLTNSELAKFAELIIQECAKIATYPQLGDEESYYGNEFAKAIKKHFGVEE
jgi:hypothetical protein